LRRGPNILTDTAVGSAREWLYPGSAGTKFESLLAEHRASDRATIERLASDDGGVWRALALALDAQPDLQLELVGCAGVHFLRAAPASGVDAIVRAISGNVAEVCASAGVHAEWDVRLRPGESLAFPTSGLQVTPSGSGRIAIVTEPAGVDLRYDDGSVRLSRSQEANSRGLQLASGDASVTKEPLLDYGGVRLTRGGLPALLKPPPGFTYTSRSPEPDDIELVATCLKVLERHRPELLREMQALPTWIVLLERGQHRLSFTADELPGVLYVNLVDPLETLDLIVHEYHHLKLDLVEARQPLLAKPTTPAVAPWRPDIRTARGVIHGAYVFMNVAHVFEPLFDAGTPSGQGRRRRVVWREAVLRACEELTSVDCGLTDFGRDLVDVMHEDAQEWLLNADGYEEERDWAHEQVQRHNERVRAGLLPEPDYMTGVHIDDQ